MGEEQGAGERGSIIDALKGFRKGEDGDYWGELGKRMQ
jgi:hypothetical protein